MTEQRLLRVRMDTPLNEVWAALTKLADLYVDNTDRDDDDIDSYEITNGLRDRLSALGILVRCDEGCSGGYRIAGEACQREHPCLVCGYTECECCGSCGNYECTCEADADEEGGL